MKMCEKLRRRVGAAALLGTWLLAAAAADAGDSGMTAQHFLDEAARGSLAEVTLGRMAAARGRAAEVREFAARMVENHAEALAEARQVAETTGAQISERMTGRHEALAERLAGADDARFDRVYMEAMVEDHQSTIGKFETQAESGDGAVAAFARKHLPVLREHLAMAQRILDGL
jgi:putative membrane protein